MHENATKFIVSHFLFFLSVEFGLSRELYWVVIFLVSFFFGVSFSVYTFIYLAEILIWKFQKFKLNF